MKHWRFLLFILSVTWCNAAVAQRDTSVKKIDIQALKNQSYLSMAGQVDCDSYSGITIERRICANLRLQREDSLLQLALDTLIAEFGDDTFAIKKLEHAQDLWEQYRFAACEIFTEDGSAHQMIEFMNCAASLTARRREELRILFEE